jgi:DNA repair photolyase
MKAINGKAIYSPKGKAAEYGRYSCNFYVGCSNGCHYCYLRKGRGKTILGGDKPTLKKCFKSEGHALEVFEKELLQNLQQLQEHGLFFSFTTDPLVSTTIDLTIWACHICFRQNVKVKILTKKAGIWFDNYFTRFNEFFPYEENLSEKISFGFTLTGHDELEPNASTNVERIEAMRKLHDAGFKTWASIEPVIDFKSSFKMIRDSRHFCDLYKIGLMSEKRYDKDSVNQFVEDVIDCVEGLDIGLYFKNSLLKAADISREDLPENCVTRDYNIFKNR